MQTSRLPSTSHPGTRLAPPPGSASCRRSSQSGPPQDQVCGRQRDDASDRPRENGGTNGLRRNRFVEHVGRGENRDVGGRELSYRQLEVGLQQDVTAREKTRSFGAEL